jgi:hypothetical protein
MKDDNVIEVILNPLLFIEADETWATIRKEEITLQAILEFICTPGTSTDVESIKSRYNQISKEAVKLFAAPHEQRMLDKLIWPLRHAKVGYMLGNYLGSIALCGMVSEMVAVLLFEISHFNLNKRTMTDEDQKNVFGSAFEKLGQDRRVQILRAYEVIDDNLKKAFDLIRTKRRKYLHLWSQDHEQLSSDAIVVYNSAILIVVAVIGQNIQDGKLILNPALLKYLDQKGIYKDKDENNV